MICLIVRYHAVVPGHMNYATLCQIYYNVWTQTPHYHQCLPSSTHSIGTMQEETGGPSKAGDPTIPVYFQVSTIHAKGVVSEH